MTVKPIGLMSDRIIGVEIDGWIDTEDIDRMIRILDRADN